MDSFIATDLALQQDALHAPLRVPQRLPFAAEILHSMATATNSATAATDKVDNRTPAEYFKAVVDHECIAPETWRSDQHFGDLAALTQSQPVFAAWDPQDIRTHACLAVTRQPGPLVVPNAHSPIGPFCVQLLPHPLMPVNALKTWKLSKLRVTVKCDEVEEFHTNAALNKNKKKRHRSATGVSTRNKNAAQPVIGIIREYPFERMEIYIFDMTLPASGCRPVKLEFSCTVLDPLNRIATFTACSNPLTVTSNCNQWQGALGSFLKHAIFGEFGATQAPFCRFFNYLQLAYLGSKGFPDERYLEPEEIRGWMMRCAVNGMRLLERSGELLEKHEVVTFDLFEAWFEVAGTVFYDLHTTNTGKLFQRLWAAGFVAIGSTSSAGPTTELAQTPGYFRLNIDTDQTSSQSYLVLQSLTRSHNLLQLERDHLDYFFEHSRNSEGCTHLMSFNDDHLVLPVESIFANSGKATLPYTFEIKRVTKIQQAK